MAMESLPEGDSTGDSQWSQVRLWALRIAPLVIIAWLCAYGYLRHPSRTPLDVSLWQNVAADRATQVAHRLLVQWGMPLGAIALVGLLSVVVLSPLVPRLSTGQRVGALFVLGVAICGLVRGVQLYRVPSLGHLLLPLSAFLLGALVGQAVLRGPRAVAWRLGQIAIAALSAVVVMAALLWMSLQAEPFPIDATAVSKGAMRGLANTIRGHRGSLDEGRQIVLSSQDLDLMLAAGLSRVSAASKGRAQIADRAIDAEVSLALPRGGKPLFLNVRAHGAAQILNGDLTLRVDRIAIGPLAVPRLLLRLISPAMGTAIRHDTELRNLVSSIASLEIEDDTVQTVFKPGECSNTFVPALAHLVSGQPKVTTQVREHVRHLVAGATSLPAGDERFVAILRQAFDFARQRSVEGDPIVENRAALLALAILLGHERVETVVGPVLDEPLREQARRELQNVTLRGRADWTKHFLVSGAIALLACEATSNKIGTLKEALDAEDGGSGFSFGDFAANRAGIRLALAATDDQDSARRLQNLLADGFAVDDVLPDVADLPENLTAAELRSQFGGVGGVEYQRLLDDIEQRLSHSAALH